MLSFFILTYPINMLFMGYLILSSYYYIASDAEVSAGPNGLYLIILYLIIYYLLILTNLIISYPIQVSISPVEIMSTSATQATPSTSFMVPLNPGMSLSSGTSVVASSIAQQMAALQQVRGSFHFV